MWRPTSTTWRRCSITTGRYAEAEPLYRRALAIAQGAGAPRLLWHVQGNLSTLYRDQGHAGLAIFFGKQAVNTLQAVRGGLSGLEQAAQQAFVESTEDYYRRLAQLLIDAGRLPEAEQVLAMLKEEEYYEFIRRDAGADARETRASLSPFEQEQKQALDAAARPLAEVARELAELKRIQPMVRTKEQRARIAALTDELDAANRRFDAALGQILAAFAAVDNPVRRGELALKQLDNDLRGLVAELSRASGETVALIHYVVSPERLDILLTLPELRRAQALPVDAAKLNQEIQTLRAALQDPGSDPNEPAQALYGRLVAPIAADLKAAGAKLLMVYLDGALRYLPLAVLHDGAHYLIEDYALSVYTAAATRNLKDTPESDWSVAGLGLSQARPGFKPLPAVPEELEGIVKHGAEDPDGVLAGVLHLEQDFSAETLRARLNEGFPVVHIASHFVFTPGTELDSFLLLGDSTRLDLATLGGDAYRFGAVELLTLSACETAVGGGEDAQGREVEGLATLTQKKGAKGVLATLWPVEDASTGALMQRFYRLRQEAHLSKAEALRQAQLGLLAGPDPSHPCTGPRGVVLGDAAKAKDLTLGDPACRWSHPYYWAPFILMGNWL